VGSFCCLRRGEDVPEQQNAPIRAHSDVREQDISTLAFWFPQVSTQWQPAETSENQETYGNYGN